MPDRIPPVLAQLFRALRYGVGDDERLVAVLHAVGVLERRAVERRVEGVLGEAQPQVVLGAHHFCHGLGGRQQVLAGVDVVRQPDAVGRSQSCETTND